MSPYVVVAGVVLAGLLLFVAAMAARRLLAPRGADDGEADDVRVAASTRSGEGWAQTNVRYFVYAFLYVIFAVDAVYLFPWATVIRERRPRPRALVEMGVFVGVLAARPRPRRPPRPAAVGLRGDLMPTSDCRSPARWDRSAEHAPKPIKVVLNWGRRY